MIIQVLKLVNVHNAIVGVVGHTTYIQDIFLIRLPSSYNIL